MSKFAKCFPGDDGYVVCQHFNGSWIKFLGRNAEKRRSTKKDVSKKTNIIARTA